jgi:hypothetical protein
VVDDDQESPSFENFAYESKEKKAEKAAKKKSEGKEVYMEVKVKAEISLPESQETEQAGDVEFVGTEEETQHFSFVEDSQEVEISFECIYKIVSLTFSNLPLQSICSKYISNVFRNNIYI